MKQRLIQIENTMEAGNLRFEIANTKWAQTYSSMLRIQKDSKNGSGNRVVKCGRS